MRREPFSLLLLAASVAIVKYQLDQGDQNMEAILTTLLGIFVQFAQNWPIMASLIVIMGTFRMFFKPLMTMLRAWAQATKSTKDDELLNKVEAHPVYKAIMFIVDYIASVKLPSAK